MNRNIGIATAYGYALSKGYQGTEEEFAEFMARLPEFAGEAAESAQAAETAQGASEDAQEAAEVARDAAVTARNAAASSASDASGSAMWASRDASLANDSAGQAEARASEALSYAVDSEAWAVGERRMVPVESTDETFRNNAKHYSQEAQAYAANAYMQTLRAEAWTVGEIGGEDVPQSDPTYQNNSKYYAELAGQLANNAGNSALAASGSAAAASAAQTAAETAQAAAEDAAESISQSAAQIGQNASDISDLKSALDEVADFYNPINLFNKNDSRNESGYYMVGASKRVLAKGTISHPIAVEKDKKYTFTISTSLFGSLNSRIIQYFDDSGNYIANDYATDNGNGTATFISNRNENVKFNINTYGINGVMFVEGETLPTDYQPYFQPYVLIKESAIPQTIKNVLNGKSVSWTGDSICYGAGYTGGYAKLIADENNMTSTNIGVSGGHIVNDSQHFCISDSIINMPISDYNIIEGGVNDASSGVTLGTLSSGYDAEINTQTFYGAFEYMLKTALIRFSGKKIGFIIPHAIVLSFSPYWTADNGYYTAVVKCCTKWGVPLLDLTKEVPPFNLLKTNNEMVELANNYTLNGDGWHPNENGYKKYYVDKITAWMKSL